MRNSHAKTSDLHAQVAGIYTFGQPRVGDADFAERLRSAYTGRLFFSQLPGDVVTKLPPSTSFAPMLTARPGESSLDAR